MNLTDATNRQAARKQPTMDTLSDQQIEAINRIPPVDASLEAPAIDERRPVGIFLDQERYDLEQEKLFKALPVPVTLSALIPEPGNLIASDIYGVPVVITRTRDGEVRAFINACTHKGSKLIEDNDPKSSGRITCPYHAWTFGLDGKLLAVPRSETISNFCKADRPLVSLPCKESGGLIWVGLDSNRDYDFSLVDDQLGIDLDALDLGSGHVYGRKRFDLNANWKLVIEPFLEGYHVQRLHAASVGPLFADVPTITDRLGIHFRQTSGKVAFDPADLKPDENIHKSITFAYQLVPSTVIITSPYYISIMMLGPRSPNRTIVDYTMITREAPDNDKAHELFEKSYEMVLGVFGGEDFRAAELSQEGLSARAMDEVIYCGLEDKIPEFYRTLDSFLEK